MKSTIIIGTGSYIPEGVKTNSDFAENHFFDANEVEIDLPGEEITSKFEKITGIRERRYVRPNQLNSDIAYLAGKKAIEDSGVDPETIDQIIVAHNFGDVRNGSIQTDILPAIASRVKHHLKIANPNCVAYDILFGCPGWVQGVIQADAFMKAGMAKTILVIGSETLSRVVDEHDRDSMIFSDGAGACVLSHEEVGDSKQGILATASMSHTLDEAFYLFCGKTNKPEANQDVLYIKMHGKKVYEYALTKVPGGIKECLDKAGVDISDLKKIFIHQANEKLDQGVVKRLYRLYGIREVPTHVMPMSVHELGNSSVATVPTLYDQVLRGELENQEIKKGDVVVFASVGAGMNVNAVCYRV
mgnify:FL=1